MDSLCVDFRSDQKRSGYDSDSSNDSASPTGSKFPEGATIITSMTEEMTQMPFTASVTGHNPGLLMATNPVARHTNAAQPSALQQK